MYNVSIKGGEKMSISGAAEIASNNLAKALKEYRKKQHISQTELGEKLGVSKQTVSYWESKKKSPKMSAVVNISNLIGVSVKELMFGTSDVAYSNEDLSMLHEPNNNYQTSSSIIPVIGTIACGEPILAEQNIEDYLSLVPSDDATYFGLKCRGHSMEPTIHDGAIAIIRQQPTVEDGEIAAVLVGEDANEATLKRVRHVNNAILLVPDNENFEPILGTKKDPIRIVGKAVRVLDIL